MTGSAIKFSTADRNSIGHVHVEGPGFDYCIEANSSSDKNTARSLHHDCADEVSDSGADNVFGIREQHAFSIAGTLATGTGTLTIPMLFDGILHRVRVACGTAPTGQAAIFDVNRGGVTVFTTQANRPTIAAAAQDSGDAIPDVNTFSEGNLFTVDVDQVGSTVAGADAVLIFEVSRGNQ